MYEFILSIGNIDQHILLSHIILKTFLLILLFSVSFFLREKISKFFISVIIKIIFRSKIIFDENIVNNFIAPFKFFLIFIFFLIFRLAYDFNPIFNEYLINLSHSLFSIFIFWFLYQLVEPFEKFIQDKYNIISIALLNWSIKSIRYFIIFIGFVAVLEIWGIRVGPILAGLGLFGVAVALGAQDLFKNLISGLMILLEKRFNIGEIIHVPGYGEGTVEQVGFRSTLLRKFDTTPINIPNYIFADVPILNYSRRVHRRINWIVGLEYRASTNQLKKIIDEIREFLIKEPEYVKNENFNQHIYIEKFNDNSIDVLIYTHVDTTDWKEYLLAKEKLAYKVKSIVEDNNASFAFPSRSIYIEKNNDQI
jgi:MscS family membrane protein